MSTEFTESPEAMHAAGVLEQGRPMSDDPKKRVFISNLNFRTTWHALKDFVRQRCGEVDFATVFKGPNGRSRGIGIVSFPTEEAAQAAIGVLNGAVFDGRVLVARSETERPPREARESATEGRPAPAFGALAGAAAAAGAPGSFAPRGQRTFHAHQPRGEFRQHSPYGAAGEGAREREPRGTYDVNSSIFVMGLPWAYNWVDLKNLCNQHGTVTYANVYFEGGRSKGVGTVRFATPEDAQRAIDALNNTVVGGRTIFVRLERPRPRPEDEGAAEGDASNDM